MKVLIHGGGLQGLSCGQSLYKEHEVNIVASDLQCRKSKFFKKVYDQYDIKDGSFLEILEKEQPRGLLDVVQFGAASCFVAQDVVDGIERLFVLHRCNDLYSPNKNVDV